MKVTVKFFASLRETLKTSQESLDVPVGVTTVADLRHHLRARGDLWAEVLAEVKQFVWLLTMRWLMAAWL